MSKQKDKELLEKWASVSDIDEYIEIEKEMKERWPTIVLFKPKDLVNKPTVKS